MTHLHRFLIALTLLVAPPSFAAAPGSGLLCVDLLLEIDFATGSSTSGGTWRLVASADDASSGFSALRVPIAGINAAVTPQLPTGQVNGSTDNNAGFTVFASAPQAGSQDLFFGQVNTPPESGDPGVFFGVGTQVNGSPNFPGQPAGTNSVGPELASLTGVSGVPFGNEPGLTAGVLVATGTFAEGLTPSFGDSSPFEAILFTDEVPEFITTAVAFTTAVVDDLVFGVATGDYNGNGTVDAADYTVYRDAFGQVVAPLTGADGDGDGLITVGDFVIWQNNFGAVSPAPAAVVAVPEPASLLIFGTLLAFKLGVSRGMPRPANKLTASNPPIA